MRLKDKVILVTAAARPDTLVSMVDETVRLNPHSMSGGFGLSTPLYGALSGTDTRRS